ncbi:hypothetical protein E3N88_04717 [Mikania micrantha]|uniref:Uncharacterized protein n=1 Tax=Mikania micrantha TaxID=192012 RepID=A0A5N6PV78_9ASTR|nr:hypothetical protein E3N88_04717 [Mikania micrantha]
MNLPDIPTTCHLPMILTVATAEDAVGVTAVAVVTGDAVTPHILNGDNSTHPAIHLSTVPVTKLTQPNMPSGPKKRRAERKKNETLNKASINPQCDTINEEKAGAEFQTADVKEKVAAPLMDDDEIILTDTNLKKTELTASDDDVKSGLGDQPAAMIITNPAKTEDTVVSAVDLRTIDAKTIESPLLVNEKTELTASDNIAKSGLADSPSMINPVVIEDTVKDSASKLHDHDSCEGNLNISSNNEQDSLKEPLKNMIDDPPAAFVHQETGQEMKLLEELIYMSTKMGSDAEMVVSLAKQLSLTLTRLLEEFNKLK